MSESPFHYMEYLRIGTVEFVSPNEIKLQLEIEAPESVALHLDGARPFPRVNGYVLIPIDDAYLVGQIEWVTIERSPFPKRHGIKDFGLVDLPYPLRKMSLNPVGILRKISHSEDKYDFRRGVDVLPTVGAPVLLPTERQLRSIVESGEKRRVRIGISPLAGNAEVYIDPDRLFGRHLAVLGNTGSGKSCTVAGLIRWSLEAAKLKRNDGKNPNARFIILDPNGEYSQAFNDSNLNGRVFKVVSDNEKYSLKVPLWFWNSSEWCAFTQASPKTQRPTLIQALRYVRDNLLDVSESRSHEMRRFLRTVVAIIRIEKNKGTPWANFPKPKYFYEKLKKWCKSLEEKLSLFEEDKYEKLKAFVDKLNELCRAKEEPNSHWDFTFEEIEELLNLASEAHSAFGGSDEDIQPPDVDAPLPFDGDSFLRCIEATAEMFNVSEHVETLLMRIRNLLKDIRIIPIIGEPSSITLEDWLANYIGSNNAENGCITVVDLSLVPSEIIHIITAVIARMVFEALQRYRKIYNEILPTVLVMEEAHTFIKRYQDSTDGYESAVVCCQVFERIAREGRKFGLGLVISSQRPSELSPTVLSQCNTFLLHRITNDRDQDLVRRLVPDNLRGLLRELPSLPTQHAILIGWASELPVLVRIDDLPKSQRPYSDDPDFWNVWTGIDDEGNFIERSVDWQPIAQDWQALKEGEENEKA